MTRPSTIKVLVSPALSAPAGAGPVAAPPSGAEEGIGRAVGDWVGSATLDTGELSKNLAAFLEDVETALPITEPRSGRFELQEVELSLAVDGKGSIWLLGSVSAGIAAGIKVKLVRKAAAKG